MKSPASLVGRPGLQRLFDAGGDRTSCSSLQGCTAQAVAYADRVAIRRLTLDVACAVHHPANGAARHDYGAVHDRHQVEGGWTGIDPAVVAATDSRVIGRAVKIAVGLAVVPWVHWDS